MGGTCGPTGSSVGWVVGSVSSRGLTPAALVEPIALAVHLEDVDVVGEAVEQRPGHLGRSTCAAGVRSAEPAIAPSPLTECGPRNWQTEKVSRFGRSVLPETLSPDRL